MRYSEAARRYGRAMYDLAKSKNEVDQVFNELRVLAQVAESEKEIANFLHSPLMSSEEKVKALKGALAGKVREDVLSSLSLLADKNRLGIFSEIVAAFEAISDEAHGVTRGVVKSAAPVSADEKKRIEESVNRVTKKKVILTYEEDPSLMGGMITQVGGWTFDDSLQTHLHKLTEVLNRN